MSREDLDYENDLKRIIDEVEDYDLDDQNVNIDDILNENDEDKSTSPSKTTSYLPRYSHLSPSNLENGKEYMSIHPLQLMETHERDITSKLGSQIDLDSKFLLSNYAATFDPNYQSIAYRASDTITKNCFPDLKNAAGNNNEYLGAPKCIAVLPPKYIAIGTSHALALIFDYAQTGFQKIGTNREQEYGAVTAIDLSSKDDSLVCGYESGHITLWGITKGDHIKTIAPIERSPILSLKFWKEIRNNFIVSDDKGIVYLYRLDSMLFQWIVDKKVLLTPADKKAEEINKEEPLPEAFFTLEVLKKDVIDGHSTAKYSLIALVSMKVVLVVSLEPVIRKVFKYERPNGIPLSCVPSVSWGRGGLPGDNNNKDPILAIAWGQNVDLFRFQNIEEEHSKGIRWAASYRSPTEIFHIEWISDGNILAFDKKREFKLLFSGHFRARGASKSQRQDFEFYDASTDVQINEPDVGFHIYHSVEDYTDKPQKPIIFYSNTIAGSPQVRRIFILGFKKVYIGRHIDWKDQLDHLKNKTEWLSALAFCVMLYKGENKSFAGLSVSDDQRKELIKPYSSDLIRDYITSISMVSGTPVPGATNEIWKTAMLTAIDFLVTIENFEFLFIETKRLFEAWDMREDFLEALESFILRNRIRFIPNEPFRDLVKHYTKKEKIDVLQYLIVNLSLKDIDVDYVITLCMEYNLLTALMYLCSHREDSEGPDFLTPIARSLSIYQRNVEENRNNKQEYGLKFLWFLDMTLRGRTFPSGEISEPIWKAKVRDIIILLFDEGNLNLMIQIEPHLSFELLHLLFEPKLTEVLDAYKDSPIQIVDTSSEKKSTSELGKIALSFSTTIQNNMQAQMLGLIYYCGKRRAEFHNMLYYMLASLAINLDYQLPVNVLEECLVYILKTPKEIPKWKPNNYKRTEDDLENISSDVLDRERNSLILGILKLLEETLAPAKIEEIKQLAEETDFVDVKAHLLGLEHQLKKCFDLYLSQPSDSQKTKIFNWLETTIPKVKAKHAEDFRAIKDSLLYRLKELVSLNSEKTRRIIVGLDSNLEVQAINKLEAFPELQYEYLKGVLSYREEGANIPDSLLVLYIRLMCQINPKQVLQEVRSATYPLDECMKLCKEYDVQDALAFFLERAGNLPEALNITLTLFKESLEKTLKNIEKNGVFKEVGNLTEKLNDAKEICIKHNKYQDPDSEALWFNVLDAVISCHQEYIANNKSIQEALKQGEDTSLTKAYRKFAKAYSNYISNLFDDMSKYITVESVLTKLESISLKLGDLKAPILGMLEAHYYESNILNDARSLAMGNNFDTLTEMQGVFIKKTEIEDEASGKVVLFNCGHLFPRSHVQGSLCTLCIDRENLKVQSVIMSARKGGALFKSKAPAAGGSSGNDRRETLQQDRERVGAAMKKGSLFRTAGANKERYIRKLDIFDDMRYADNREWDDEGVGL